MLSRNLKAILASLGAALSVLGGEYLGIPEEAGRTFLDSIIGMIDVGTSFTVIVAAVLTFILTWFFPNK